VQKHQVFAIKKINLLNPGERAIEMANVKNVVKMSDVIITRFEKKEDEVYKIYFVAFDGEVHKYNATFNGELYFSNLISTEDNIVWIDLEIEQGDTWTVTDIIFQGTSLVHKNDWILNAFKSKGGAC
jgi:hypothetical protein